MLQTHLSILPGTTLAPLTVLETIKNKCPDMSLGLIYAPIPNLHVFIVTTPVQVTHHNIHLLQTIVSETLPRNPSSPDE